jgi:hypothetical protein
MSENQLAGEVQCCPSQPPLCGDSGNDVPTNLYQAPFTMADRWCPLLATHDAGAATPGEITLDAPLVDDCVPALHDP